MHRVGEIREDLLRRWHLNKEGGESASHVSVCSKRVLGGGNSQCNPQQECAWSVSGIVRPVGGASQGDGEGLRDWSCALTHHKDFGFYSE